MSGQRSVGGFTWGGWAAVALALALAGTAALAEQLIVLRDGTLITTPRVKLEKGQFLYYDTASSKTNTVATNLVDGVVSTVVRGRSYSPEQIKKVIDKITVLRRQHPKLVRILKPIQEEWIALQRPAAPLDDKIAALVQCYEQSPKDYQTRKRVALDLEMLRYSDLQGKYKQALDSALQNMNRDFVDVNLQRLHVTTNAPRLTVQDFVRARQLAEDTIPVAGPADRALASNVVASARKRVFDSECARARDRLTSGSASIDSYLECVSILDPVQREVVAGEEYRARFDRVQTYVLATVRKAQPQYAFDYHGFPMTPEDRRLLSEREDRATLLSPSPSAATNEQCLLIPLENPPLLRSGEAFQVPVRLLFRNAQPAGRSYALSIQVPGQNSSISAILRFGAVTITNGRADGRVGARMTFEPGFQPATDSTGQAWMRAHVVARDDAGSDPAGWRPISLDCRWPVDSPYSIPSSREP